jgi:hypothetical protein
VTVKANSYGLHGPWYKSQQRGETCMFFEKHKPALGPKQPPVQWIPWIFPYGGGGGQSGRSVTLTIQLQLLKRLRMGGAVPLLPLYALTL